MNLIIIPKEELKQIVKEAVSDAIELFNADKQQHDGEYISRARVCELLKISKPTLYRWRRSGKLPNAVYLGGKVLVKKAEIVKVIENGGFEM